jgi:5-methylcytosine-specific restriction endonuclease McrA
MLSIVCPQDDAATVFIAAATRTRDNTTRNALLSEAARVGTRAAEYLRLALNEELYRLAIQAPTAVTSAVLADVYDRALVAGGERKVYNRIMASAKFKRCPLCGDRDVKTLDHYLPKTYFPELSVFPANLIPSCSDCNKIKGTNYATAHEQQTFHPYFDDWSTTKLLRSIVSVDVGSVSVSFDIFAPPGCRAETISRAEAHFTQFDLGTLYAAKAAVELVECKSIFEKHFLDGSDVLRSELEIIARSRQRSGLNGWRPALYWGLSQSIDFCNGGFLYIDQ